MRTYAESVAYKWLAFPGQELRKWRQEKLLTLKDCSILFGTSISHLSDIESERHAPSVTLLKIMVDLTNRTEEQIRNIIDYRKAKL